MKVEDLEIDDLVVIDRDTHYRKKYTFERVIKLTKTQIITEKDRYNKTSRYRTGGGNSYHPKKLAGNFSELLDVADAKTWNAKYNAEHRHDDLAKALTNIKLERWLQLDEETLEQIWRQIN